MGGATQGAGRIRRPGRTDFPDGSVRAIPSDGRGVRFPAPDDRPARPARVAGDPPQPVPPGGRKVPMMAIRTRPPKPSYNFRNLHLFRAARTSLEVERSEEPTSTLQ